MKTQISRHSHRPEKRYSGVYQQQGRMITDADWNELVEIVKEKLAEALRDVVASGAPRESGMEILPQTPSGFVIRGGWIYADGVAARVEPAAGIEGDTFTYDQQADFPSPPPLPTSESYLLYADVWERTVVSLEDPPDDPHLRDPALHGADTTTRTQTMAQIKWRPFTTSPEEQINPPRGNAELTLRLRARREQADPCDPCADEVAVATRTGNYLFRLEVHDVDGLPGAPSELTLKWSSENGAEQHEVDRAPSEFKTGDWIYEFYSETSEKHLGVHLVPGVEPVRGLLEPGWPATPPQDVPWVRRWDGYCVLERDAGTWRLVAGKDRVTELSTAGPADADGHVALAGDRLGIQLKALTLTLTLSLNRLGALTKTEAADVVDAIFVAGDYWLAPVREAMHQAGSVVLEDAPPLGIVHHYLRLASVGADGKVKNLPPAEHRRLSFPPLTDLWAGDVGYQCDELPRVTTVREALDALRDRSGGGCRITVGPGGDLESLEEIPKLPSPAGNLCLCLLPGDHQLADGFAVDPGSDPTHVCIEGCGPGSRVVLGGKLTLRKVASLHLRNLSFQAAAGGQLAIEDCGEVRAESVSVVEDRDAVAVAGRQANEGLMVITGAKRLYLAQSSIETADVEAAGPVRSWQLLQEVARVLAGSPAAALFGQELDEEFVRSVPVTAKAFHEEYHDRKDDAKKLRDQAKIRLANSSLSEPVKELLNKLLTHLLAGTVSEEHVASLLRGIWDLALLPKLPATALAVSPGGGDVTLVDCVLTGTVSFYGPPVAEELSRPELATLRQRDARIGEASGRLCLSRNQISRLVLGQEMVEQLRNLIAGKAKSQTIDGAYRAAFLTDNLFLSGVLQVLARHVKLSSNELQDVRHDDRALLIADTAICLGNQDVDSDHEVLDAARKSVTENNLMSFVKP